MKWLAAVLSTSILACSAQGSSAGGPPGGGESVQKEEKKVVMNHRLETLEGGTFDFTEHRGKAILVVNVASRCGYTPQYEGLQKLHETYGPKGLVVVGIPSNDFGGQEPGTAEEIRSFCDSRFGVSFPILAKVHAKGPDIAPVYATLTGETAPPIAGEVRWNFTKFLVDKDGVPVARFEPKVEPLSEEMISAIEATLGR